MSATLTGTPAFRRTVLALFAAGFATFALLYSVQPLMPIFAATFGISAARASLSLSVSTATLALSMLVASSLSEVWGRKPLMMGSLLASALLTLAAALAPGWTALLALRAAEGVSLSGLPAVTMAYVSEEMDKRAVGLAMGLYISGSGLGGMAGRLASGVIAEAAGWRAALAALGLLGLAAFLVLWAVLPPSRNFTPRPLRPRALLGAFAVHLAEPGLRKLFALGFVLLGSFVTIYNYVGFRLLAPPYGFNQAQVGLIFTVYLVGVASAAWIGDLAGRLGRRRVLWTMLVCMLSGLFLTLASPVSVIVLGMAVLTLGFFGGHSIASSWVGARARQARGQAAALYLFFYYLGSSVLGTLGGWLWDAAGWPGVVGLTTLSLGTGLAIALRLTGTLPLP